MFEPIKVKGLNEFARNLKKLDAEAPKGLRVALNGAADVVVDHVRPQIPRVTGRAAKSLKAKSTRTAVRVAAGGGRVGYFPWLDYGGEGRRSGRPPKRPFIKAGRYLYPGYYATRDRIEAKLGDAIVDTARRAGLDVD